MSALSYSRAKSLESWASPEAAKVRSSRRSWGLLGEEGLVTRGDIWYKGENLTDMSEKKLRKLLGTEIGMVFQDCKAALCPVRTIGAQIHEAVSEHEKISQKEVRERAGQIMKKIGLNDSDRVLDSYPFELSGGMNQRVGICTAMIMHPNLLLVDEPTSALDVTVQKQVVEELLLMRKDIQYRDDSCNT